MAKYEAEEVWSLGCWFMVGGAPPRRKSASDVDNARCCMRKTVDAARGPHWLAIILEATASLGKKQKTTHIQASLPTVYGVSEILCMCDCVLHITLSCYARLGWAVPRYLCTSMQPRQATSAAPPDIFNYYSTLQIQGDARDRLSGSL